MTYLILKKSSCPLYMADRSKTKSFWWTYKLSLAMEYYSREEAQKKADTFKYGTFRVITKSEAMAIRFRADSKHEEMIEERRERFDYMHNYDPGDSEYWDNSDNGHEY